jgi:ankyrin repeat protein
MTPAWKAAVRRGSINELQQLLVTGTDIDARDEYGQTALMLAAVAGHTHVVEWLVERSARLDNTAKYGLSALMLAVVNGHVAIVGILVRAGASLELRGSGAPGFAGKTALDLAIDRNHQEMVDILSQGPQRVNR